MTKINTAFLILNITNNHIEMITNKASETSKCTSKNYATTPTFFESNTQNKETTSETEYTPTTDMEDTLPTTIPETTEAQPMMLDTLISEITAEAIPDALIPNNDKILIKVRSTSWTWTSSRRGRVSVKWKIPFVNTDFCRTQCMDGDTNCTDDNYRRECWTFNCKKTCTRLAMADEPAKKIELPDLTIGNRYKISTHQAFLIL